MHKLSYKTLFIIFFFLLIGIVILLKINSVKKVSAGWWNDGWMYRKAVSVTNSSGSNLTNFQVSFSIGTSALINAGKMKSDCSDIRITDINGNIIPFWIEENNPGCNQVTDTKIWTKAPSISTSGATVFVYYGNPSATSVQNGEQVFEFFDDFSSGLNNWTIGDGTWGLKNQNGNVIGREDDPTTTGLEAYASSYTAGSQYVYEGRMYMKNDGGTYHHGGLLFNGQSTTSYELYYMRSHQADMAAGYTTTGSLNFYNTNVGTTTPPQDIWKSVKVVVKGTSADTYYDGTLQYTISSLNHSSGGKIGVFDYGAYTTNEKSVYFDDLRIRKYASADPTSSLQSEELSPAPIAYWKFDEGIGTTVYDSTSNLHNGVLSTGSSAPTWQTEDQCISGKCIFTKGQSTSYIDTNYDFSLDYNSSSSISFWFKPTTNNTGGLVKNIIAKNSYEFIISQEDQKIRFIQWTSGGSDALIFTTSNFIQPNSWYFINFIYDSAQHKGFIYVNGKLDGSANTASSDFINRTETLKIGTGYQWSGSTSPHYTGFIDDVKIYPYARTATQIKQDYNSGKSHASTKKGSSVNLGGSNKSGEFLSDGLVGYWKMEENTGTTTLDSSGNNNTGTFGTGNSAPTWTSGKYGIGISFDGIGDYISCGTSPSLNITNAITISAWVNVGGTQTSYSRIVAKNWFYDLRITNTNKITLSFQDGSPSIGALTSNTALISGTWYHVVGTYDPNGGANNFKIYINGIIDKQSTASGVIPSNSTSSLIIGALSSINGYFNGSYDEIRIYNRALSPSEVSNLYNWAPGPVGYWDFNENISTTAYDKSGNNNNGAFGTGNSAPTWISGKIGSALKFDGNNDYINASNPSSLNLTKNITLEAWIKPTALGNYGIITKAWTEYAFSLVSSGKLRFESTNIDQSSNSTIPINKWSHVVVTYDMQNVKFYINGVLDATLSDTDGLSSGSNNLSIGKKTNETWYFLGSIDEAKIYNYARTQKQIVEDMLGDHSSVTSGGPNAAQLIYYKFDEGYGTTARNSGTLSSSYNATLTGEILPTWQNNGKFNKALYFYGIGQTNRAYITTSPLNIGSSGSQMTFSFWINPDTSQPGTGYFVRNGTGTDQNYGFRIDSPSSGKYKITLDRYTGSFTSSSITNYLIPVSQWSHIAVVLTEGVNWKFYFNGKYIETISIGGTAANSTSSLNIGGHTGAWGQYFNGYLDEFKIYNYDLTDDEVKLDYNHGSAIQMGSTNQTIGGTTTSLEYCIPGDTSACSAPIGEWKMEEGTGSISKDTAGNNNIGVSNPTWSPGKNGSGLTFNGVYGNYYGVINDPGINGTNNFTISYWIKPNPVISFTDSFSYGDNLFRFENNGVGGSDITIYNPGISSSSISLPANSIIKNIWNHLTITCNSSNWYFYVNGILKVSGATQGNLNGGSVINLGMRFAGAGTNPWKGSIDHIKIYNYARTPAQIAYDYNKGGPVGWWKLDECQGLTAFDSSGLGNTGAISIGPSGSQNTAGTCQVGTSAAWTAGASGKINSSLNFDGTDDKVNMGDPTNGSLDFGLNDFTTVAWFKTSTINQGIIVGKYSGYPLFYSGINNGIVESRIGFDGSTNYSSIDGATLNDGNWHQIIVVYKRNGNMTKYLDGKIYGTPIDISPSSAVSVNNTNNFTIAASGASTQFFLGQIDDVRIYNYALTATQVKTLYNNGAVSFN